jgi:hypothetical protein
MGGSTDQCHTSLSGHLGKPNNHIRSEAYFPPLDFSLEKNSQWLRPASRISLHILYHALEKEGEWVKKILRGNSMGLAPNGK